MTKEEQIAFMEGAEERGRKHLDRCFSDPAFIEALRRARPVRREPTVARTVAS